MTRGIETDPSLNRGWNKIWTGFGVLVGGAAIGLVGYALSSEGRSSYEPTTGQHFAANNPGKYSPEDIILEALGSITVVGGAGIMIRGARDISEAE